jgi:hypothetical protein
MSPQHRRSGWRTPELTSVGRHPPHPCARWLSLRREVPCVVLRIVLVVAGVESCPHRVTSQKGGEKRFHRGYLEGLDDGAVKLSKSAAGKLFSPPRKRPACLESNRVRIAEHP